MKKTLILCIAAMLATGFVYSKSKTKIVAHRGYWNTEGSAQNSISSIKNAMDASLFGTEFDVWITADDVPVVFHDRKTKNGLAIEKTSLAELLDKADKLANGETIPTLAQYLQAWKPTGTKLVLEIKTHSTPERNMKAVERILAEVAKAGIDKNDIEYIAFDWGITTQLVKANTGSMVSYLNGDKTPQELKDAGVDGFDYSVGVLKKNPEWIAEAKKLKLNTNVWTVKPKDMQHFINAGVDYITTDYPAELFLKLGKKK